MIEKEKNLQRKEKGKSEIKERRDEGRRWVKGEQIKKQKPVIFESSNSKEDDDVVTLS